MRGLTLILGAGLTGSLVSEAISGFKYSRSGPASNAGLVMPLGLLMALLWLVATGLVGWRPGVTTVLFLVAAALAAAAGIITDIRALFGWGGISIVLAATSYFGHRDEPDEKRT